MDAAQIAFFAFSAVALAAAAYAVIVRDSGRCALAVALAASALSAVLVLAQAPAVAILQWFAGLAFARGLSSTTATLRAGADEPVPMADVRSDTRAFDRGPRPRALPISLARSSTDASSARASVWLARGLALAGVATLAWVLISTLARQYVTYGVWLDDPKQAAELGTVWALSRWAAERGAVAIALMGVALACVPLAIALLRRRRRWIPAPASPRIAASVEGRH